MKGEEERDSFDSFQRYQLKILDHTQPLLVSKPSRRNRRAGITGPILLIPEFCRETGNESIVIVLVLFSKEASI